MIVTFFATIRLLRAVGRAMADPATRGIVILAGVILLGGTLFYMNAEGWGVIDSLYFCVITLGTVGYGDLVPTTTASKVFTIIYSLIGIGVIAGFVTSVAMTVVHEPGTGRGKHGRRRPDPPGEATT